MLLLQLVQNEGLPEQVEQRVEQGLQRAICCGLTNAIVPEGHKEIQLEFSR